MKKLLLCMILLCGSAFAQGSFYQLQQPLPNATLRVCPLGAVNPCPTPSNIFSDSGLTQAVTQPVQLGPSGNYGFWIASGQYLVQVAQPYNLTFVISLGNGSGGGASTNAVIPNQTLDNFARASLGANWTTYLNSVSTTTAGQAQGGTAAQLNVVAYTGVTTNPTQTSRVTIKTLNGATDSIGAAIRISGTPTTSVSYYACTENSTTLTLARIVGASNASTGTNTTLGTSGITGGAGDQITLSVVGNTVSCQRNATNPILQVNDGSPLTTGLPGVSFFGNVATIHSFTLTNSSAPTGAAANIIFDGDSIIAANGNGSNFTDPATSFLYLGYPNAYAINLGVQSKCLGVGCAAQTSGTIESMLSTGTSVIDTLLVTGAKNIVVLWGGTNDMALAARTPAQVYTDMTTYITARHAAGWKVVVVPPLSRQCTLNVALDNNEAQLGALVNANTGAADAVVTLPSSITNVWTSCNTNFFASDQIHPLEIAHIDVIARAINATISRF